MFAMVAVEELAVVLGQGTMVARKTIKGWWPALYRALGMCR